MKQKITTKRLTFSVFCFILSSTLLTRHFIDYSKKETWLAVLLGYISSLPVLWLFSSLSKRYRSLSLFGINEAVFGCVTGKIISVLYILFFLMHTFLHTTDAGNFVKGWLLPNTPLLLIIAMIIFVCSLAVRNGADKFTNDAVLFVAITLVSMVLTTLLLARNIKFENILPILRLPVKEYVAGASIIMLISFCDIFVFYALIPDLKEPEKFGRSLFIGLTLGAIVMLFVVVRDTLILGASLPLSNLPTYDALRLINVGDILTRMEAIYSFILITLSFFKICIFYYAIVTGIRYVFKLDSYKILVNIIGTLIVLYGTFIFPSNADHLVWTRSGAEVYMPFFFIVLMPLTTLINAAIYKILKKNIVQ